MALPAVSEARLVQNLYAEYPDMKSRLSKLRGEKTEQTVESLMAIWGLNEDNTLKVVENAISVGFFERREVKGRPTYWVPFLFRDALEMSQGLADDERRRGAAPKARRRGR
jgi:hypothetical protein